MKITSIGFSRKAPIENNLFNIKLIGIIPVTPSNLFKGVGFAFLNKKGPMKEPF
jgi:hypothetical protein